MITLEILAAYYPHKLKGIFTDLPGEMPFEVVGITIENEEELELINVRGCPGRYGGHASDISNFKPILQPLSELKDDKETAIKIYAISCREHHQAYLDIVKDGGDFDTLPRYIFDELCRRHYNVFNLKENEYIRKG